MTATQQPPPRDDKTHARIERMRDLVFASIIPLYGKTGLMKINASDVRDADAIADMITDEWARVNGL